MRYASVDELYENLIRAQLNKDWELAHRIQEDIEFLEQFEFIEKGQKKKNDTRPKEEFVQLDI